VTLSPASTVATSTVAANTVYSNVLVVPTGITASARIGINEFRGLFTDGTYFTFMSIQFSSNVSSGNWDLNAIIKPISTMAANTYTLNSTALKINVYT
jgi:hypothetical protein